MEISNLLAYFYPLYTTGFVFRFPILFWPIKAQIPNVSVHYVEVCCVPSANHVSRKHQSQNSVLKF